MTTTDLDLKKLTMEYEDMYFKDMSFQLFAEKLYSVDKSKLQCTLSRPPRLNSLEHWTVMFKPTLRGHGDCKHKKQTIWIKPLKNRVKLESALLHEMIHAYEVGLDQHHRDYVFLYLYKELLKHPEVGQRLDWMIDTDANDHCFSGHSLLFLLKSIDLDLKLGFQIGTVYGYERDVIFSTSLEKWLRKKELEALAKYGRSEDEDYYDDDENY